MNRLRIVVFAGAPIFPVTGMHQVRIINQMKSLAQSHEVTFAFLCNKASSFRLTQQGLTPLGISVIPIKTFTQSFIFRILAKFILKRFFSKYAFSFDHFVYSNLLSSKKIAKTISKRNFDAVVSHYWEASGFLRYLNTNILKCIDTHYLVEENLQLLQSGHYSHLDSIHLSRVLRRECVLQWKYFISADLLIVNSHKQTDILSDLNCRIPNVCIPNGQDLTDYLMVPILENPQKLNLLFYGSLSNQFNSKGLRRLLDSIYPMVTSINHNIDLVVMGSSPPDWLLKRSRNDSRIKVTGFVENPKLIFQTCFCCVLPLDSGSGFRGRTIELMASGVPIVGTHNALDSVGLINGFNGIVSDDDEIIAKAIMRLAEDEAFRLKLARNARSFVNSKFSLDKTHGRLSKYLSDRLS